MAEDLHKRMVKRFASELELWSAENSTHLIVIATFSVSTIGVVSIEELALAVASSNWIPVEHAYDLQLLDALTRAHRRFTNGLRYNLAGDRPLASAVLTDTSPRPVALYVVPPDASNAYKTALDKLVEASDLAPWFWRTGEQTLPALPALVGYEPAASNEHA
jgi:hypothetical protein